MTESLTTLKAPSFNQADQNQRNYVERFCLDNALICKSVDIRLLISLSNDLQEKVFRVTMFTKAKASQTNECDVNYFFVVVNSTGNQKH